MSTTLAQSRLAPLTLLAPLAIALALGPAACDQGASASESPDANAAPGAEASQAALVPNLEAQPGDTTTCPFSGRPFVVEANLPKVDYEGQSYWVCSEEAAEQVRADPARYLADFEG